VGWEWAAEGGGKLKNEAGTKKGHHVHQDRKRDKRNQLNQAKTRLKSPQSIKKW